MEGVKKCTKCRIHKSISEFHKDKNRKDNLAVHCNDCVKKTRRKWYLKNKEKISTYSKKYRLENKEKIKIRNKNYRENNREKISEQKKWYDIYKNYGLTIDEYHILLKKQNNKCKICNINLVSPCVDHCHKTGIIRGLLCNNCNKGLGNFFDDIKYLLSAIKYLKKNEPIHPSKRDII